ncbi:hypothetical protein H6503_05605 [Candidatus Woesearchaeota archaeon]|nr:hypothetical protein [Candidatus Woesearchaeota archaeon]
MMIHWPQVIVVTIVLYVLIIISLPFNAVYATLFLFAIIAYWSRLPGVGIPSPFFILYLADVVDLLSVIVSINVGPLQGAVFSAFGNFGSRLAGIFPKWWSVVRDSSFQFIICLMMPFIHDLSGGNLEMSMFFFTLIRRILFIFVYIFYQDIPLPNFIGLWIGATASSILINVFYAKYFGWFFDGLIQSGVEFNWLLFLIVTVIVLTGKVVFFGRSSVRWLDQSYILRRLFKGFSQSKRKKRMAVNDDDARFVHEIMRKI